MSDKRYVWVLAYILRFSGEPGEWGQVMHRGFTSEKEANDYRQSIKGDKLYSVCKVEIPFNVRYP